MTLHQFFVYMHKLNFSFVFCVFMSWEVYYYVVATCKMHIIVTVVQTTYLVHMHSLFFFYKVCHHAISGCDKA